MARFEEFRVTLSKNPSRFGMVGALVVLMVYLMNYQGPCATPSDARMVVPAMLLAGEEVQVTTPDSVFVLGQGSRATGDQCIGGPIILALPVKLFGPAGAHLFYAMIPAIFSLLIYGMTARVFGRRWLGFCAQLLAGLNPFMLSYQNLHPAFIATTLVAAVMYLLMDPARHYLLLGMLFGALVAVENAALIFAPVILLMLATNPDEVILRRVADGGLTLLGFILALAPALYWKEVTFGSIIVHPREALYEGAGLFSHSILGWEFHSAALFNYPLREGVVRTPHFPFPTFLCLPMALARGLGLILSAVFFMGVGPLHREDRRLTRFLLAWVILAFLWWGFQEDWDERRMAGAMMIIPGAVLLIAAGILRFARISSLRSNIITLAAVTGLLLVSIKGTQVMEFPQDPRWDLRHPAAAANDAGLNGLPLESRLSPLFHQTPETPEEIATLKQRCTEGNLLPTNYLPSRWEPGESLEGLLELLSDPHGVPTVPLEFIAPSRP